MSSLRSFAARGPADTFAPWFMAAVLAGGVFVLADDGCTASAQDSAAGNASAAQRSSGSHAPFVLGEGPESDEAAMRESRKARLSANQIAELLTTLLRALVAEATWLAHDRAILHVLARRADRAGVAVEEMARMYISAFKRPPARVWVLELEPTCEQPPSWPESLDWETWKPQCELTVERIEAFLDGDSIDPCKGRAMHFGAPDLAPDLANAADAGWRVVNCGGTASRFYADRGRVISAQDARGSR